MRLRLAMRGIFFLLLIAATTVSVAQQRGGAPAGNFGGGPNAAPKAGKITGIVLDKTTNLPVEYANITVLRSKDSTFVTGGITDSKGVFSIDKVPFGMFTLKVKFIGYATTTLKGVKLTQASANVGSITIAPSSKNLEEVTVVGKKNEVQNNLDKKVYNIDKTMYGTGGTALDIMQSLPAVQVDFEGNVSMRGSSVTILIDGRPSNLVSLDQMPAHLIQRVEVITNPSAKYDPEGTSGIINIVLKKNRQRGLNGMLNVNAGWNNKYMGSLALNYRKNKVNYFVNYTLRSFEGDSYQSLWTKATSRDTTNYRAEESTSPGKFRMQNIQGGFDYFINDKNTINTSFTLEPRTMNGSENAAGFINRTVGGSTSKIYDYTRNSWSKNQNKGGFEYDLSYKHAFNNDGHELTAELNIDRGNMESEQGSIQRYNPLTGEISYPEYRYQIINTTNDNIRSFVRADYVLPLAEKGRLEIGYQLTMNSSDMTNDQSITLVEGAKPNPIPELDDDFNYRMLVNALYFNYGVGIGKFKIQLGIRGENADTHGEQKTQNTSFSNTYLDLFPSAFVKYALTEKDEIGINYSRRTNRPRMWQLNPFENRTNDFIISKGNPELDPEYVNSFELGYTKIFGKKNSLSLTGFYRKTTGVIGSIREQLSASQALITYLNLNSSETYGGELAANVSPFKWWSLNANYSYFHINLTDKTNTVLTNDTKESDSWTLRATSNWFITKKFTAQLMYNYRSPVVSLGGGGYRGMSGGTQGKTQANYYFDAGLRYSILKDRGDVSLRVSDIFNTNKYILDEFGPSSVGYRKSWRETPNIFVGFSYRINDYKRKPQSNNQDQNDEMGGM